MIFFPEGSNVKFAFCLLKDRTQYWWEEVDHALRDEVVETTTWDDFVIRFRANFTSVIMVYQFMREFQDLHQTTETIKEINVMFQERDLLVT